MAIRFLRDYTVQDRERTAYAMDEVRDDLSPESEAHFVNRNIAAYTDVSQSKSSPREGKAESVARPSRRKSTKRSAS